MQIVIEIPEAIKDTCDNDTFEHATNYASWFNGTLVMAIKNGTQLPKGHGRLKDIDEIEWYGCTSEYECPYKNIDCKDCDRAECSKTQVDSIPTIIPADKGDD